MLGLENMKELISEVINDLISGLIN
jgi:hypothetical protein